jgi:carbohydrate diacid regulator
MLTAELAKEIVQETMDRVHRNINIIDERGIIIGSGDASRIGQFHEAGYEAIRLNRVVVVDSSRVSVWRGAQIGVNVPVVDDSVIVGAIGITGSPREVEPLAQLVKMTTELMIRQKKVQHQEEWRQRMIDGIVAEFIDSRESDRSRLEQKLQLLHLSFKAPYRVLLLSTTGGEANRLFRSAEAAFNNEQVLISQVSVEGIAMVIAGLQTEGIRSKLTRISEGWGPRNDHPPFTAACSGAVSDLSEIGFAFDEAQLASRVHQADDALLVEFEHVAAEALVQALPAAHLDRLCAKVRPFWNDKMEETLSCVFDCSLNMAEAVRRLGIHRNTMLYRIERIKTATGYDPLHFHDAMVLQWVAWSIGRRTRQ